jgi:hypothetical protein
MDVFHRQQGKSARKLTITAILGLAIIVAGIAGTWYLNEDTESNRLVIEDLYPDEGLNVDRDVLVKSSEFFDARLYTGKSGENPDSRFYLLPLFDEDYYLIAAVPIETKEDYTDDVELDFAQREVREFRGKLEAMSYEQRMQFIESLEEYGYTYSEALDYVPAVYISMNAGVKPVWIVSIAGLVLFIVSLVSLGRRGKIRDRMDSYGVGETEIMQFEDEYAVGYEKYGNLSVTEHWIFNKTASDTWLLPLSAIVWMYGAVTQHRTNGIPTGKTYAANLFFSDKLSTALPTTKKSMDDLIVKLAARCPNALIGYSDERADEFKRAVAPVDNSWWNGDRSNSATDDPENNV